jgi:DNA-binding NarL/FixJ family response regulator
VHEATTVVIADDHEISRIGIRRLLGTSQGITVIGEAIDGYEALEMTRAKKPHVVLLDVRMPNLSGIDVAQRLKTEMPGVFVIMLSAAEDQMLVEQALYAGADGYLSKDVSSVELVAAVNGVIKSERVFSPVIRDMINSRTDAPAKDTPKVALTRREEEVISLVAKGLTSQDIGKRLNISPRTVETHRARIMTKIGVSNAAGLVRYALMYATYFGVGTNDAR